MDVSPETTSTDAEKSFNWHAFILWPIVAVILYILSLGPVVAILDRNGGLPNYSGFFEVFYYPMDKAYETPWFHKPIGIYLHWWDAKRFDEHGEGK
jgi:hypothetical protein